jgi:hypothetical protein
VASVVPNSTVRALTATWNNGWNGSAGNWNNCAGISVAYGGNLAQK